MTDDKERPGEKKPEENSEKPAQNANLENTETTKKAETKKPKFDAMKASDADFKAACAELSRSERERKPIEWPGFTGKIAGMKVEDMDSAQFAEAERQFLAFKPYTGSATMPSVLALD